MYIHSLIWIWVLQYSFFSDKIQLILCIELLSLWASSNTHHICPIPSKLLMSPYLKKDDQIFAESWCKNLVTLVKKDWLKDNVSWLWVGTFQADFVFWHWKNRLSFIDRKPSAYQKIWIKSAQTADSKISHLNKNWQVLSQQFWYFKLLWSSCFAPKQTDISEL